MMVPGMLTPRMSYSLSAGALIVFGGVPCFQLTTRSRLSLPDRAHAEHAGYADDADAAAQLNEVADVFRRSPHDLAAGDLAQLHGIVGDEAMAALDQFNGQLALPMPLSPRMRMPLTVNFHQHAVAGDAGASSRFSTPMRLPIMVQVVSLPERSRATCSCLQAPASPERVPAPAAAEDDGRRLLAEQPVKALTALFRRKTGQKFISARPMICKRIHRNNRNQPETGRDG